MNRSRRPILAFLLRAAAPLALALSAGQAVAEPLRYDVVIPDGEAAAYSVEIEVPLAGRITVRVDGEHRRSIALRLDPPDGATVRRSGPTPLTLDATADPGTTGLGTWRLELRAPAGRGPASLRVSIELPEPTPRPAPPPRTPVAPAATPRPVTPWDAARRRAAPPEHRAFLDAAEAFAEPGIPDGGPPVDACRWQGELGAYLEKRATGLRAGRLPPPQTRELLARIARAVDAVAALRDSTDPLLAGPRPDDRQVALAWQRARAERLAPLEAELDELLATVQLDHAPELARSSWPARLVTCLTACERYFDERVRAGERGASNRELTQAQWPRIVAAASVLRELSRVEPSSTARAQP